MEKKSQEMKMSEIKSNCRTFQYGEDPELVHIIKTGFKDRYMLVYEDAYEFMLGKVEFATKAQILERFDIDIDSTKRGL